MVEMLMAAFILAIGILGLTMLQTMSVKAVTGSRGLNTAVLIADRTMDEIMANGRNSCSFARSLPAVLPPEDLTNVFTQKEPAPERGFNFAGRPSEGDPIDPVAYFWVSVVPETDPDASPGAIAAIPRFGGVANMIVTVRWNEDPAAPARQVVLSRRVPYATEI